MLRDISQAILASLDLNEVLQRIMHHLKRMLRFYTCSVLLYDTHGRPDLVVGIGYQDERRTIQDAGQKLGDSRILARICQEFTTVMIPDVRQDPDWIWVAGAEHVRTFLGVPIISRQKLSGVLMIDRTEVEPFSDEDIHLVQSLAEQMAIAIENARLYKAAEKRAAELESIRQASLSLTASLELSQVFEAILKSALNLLGEASNSHIFLYYPEEDRLKFGAAWFRNQPQATPFTAPRPNGLTYTVARTGKLILAPDMRQHPLFANTPPDWGGAIIGLPLHIGERVVGVMNIAYPAPHCFTPDEIHVVELLADQAAIAIENARLFEQAAAERRHLSLLYDISRELVSSLDTEEILQRAITLVCQALGGRVGQAYLYLEEDDCLALRAIYGRPQSLLTETKGGIRIPLGTGLAGWVGRHGQPAYLPDVHKDERWFYYGSLDEGISSAISAPFFRGEGAEARLLGVLSVFHSQTHAFSTDHLPLLQAICREVGLAYSNARRYQEAQRRLAEITLIQNLTQAFNQRLDLHVLIEEIVQQIHQKLGYDQVEFFLVEGDQLVLSAWRGSKPMQNCQQLSQGVVGRVARSGQAALVTDVSQDPDYLPCVSPEQEQIVAELCVPILQGPAVAGLINVESYHPDQLDRQDLELLQMLSAQTAVAFENARLYERARLHAEELEQIVARRTAELSELYMLSQEIGYQLSPEELLRLLLSRLRNAVQSDLVLGCLGIGTCRAPLVNSRGALGEQALEEVRSRWEALLEEHYPTGASGTPLTLNVQIMDDQAAPAGVIGHIAAWLHAPVLIDHQLVGLLAAGSETPGAFGIEQARLFTTFANQAATAFEHITEIRAAQQKHLENLVENMPFGVLLLDAGLRLLAANPLGRQILAVLGGDGQGEALASLGGVPLSELIAHQDDAMPLEIAAPGRPARIFSAQILSVRTGLPDEGSQWVLSLREVTAEREQQGRIQSQERLATVGQLAAGIAHDFNNIMAAIQVYADLLISDPGTAPTSREKLGIIQQQVQRASSLIRQILDFSRQSVMDRSPLDLLPFIKELDKLLGRIMPETIHLELVYHPGEYWVNADPTSLQQAFMNLALNARDAMAQGGALRFELGFFHLNPDETPPFPAMPPGDWVCIRLTDTGEGIPQEVLNHIFEPFFSTKPVGEGTGLGLAQVYGIIKQHDGFIDVHSQVGAGASFIIYLPMFVRRAAGESLDEVAANALARPLGAGRTALVVEDDQATRQALRALLESQAFRVVVAANGLEALKVYEQVDEKPSLVVSDVVMPQMGGVALYDALQKRTPGMKMLFVTGHPLDGDAQVLLTREDVPWLQKPFQVQDFLQAVRKLLENTSSA